VVRRIIKPGGKADHTLDAKPRLDIYRFINLFDSKGSFGKAIIYFYLQILWYKMGFASKIKKAPEALPA
jgi:hypothetical protein